MPSSFHRGAELVRAARDLLADAQRSDSDGPATGLRGLDDMGDLSPGQVVVLAGRPGMGTTVLAFNIVVAMLRQGVPVAAFTAHHAAGDVAFALLGIHSGCRAVDLRWGDLDPSARDQLARSEDFLAEAPFYLDDTPALELRELQERAHTLREVGLGLLVVDSLAVFPGAPARALEVLRDLAAELQCAVLVTSPISRRAESRSDKRPRIDDLAGARAIQRLAHAAWLLYRDDYYDADSPEPGTAEIGRSVRGSNGMTGWLCFDRRTLRFGDMEPSALFDRHPARGSEAQDGAVI